MKVIAPRLRTPTSGVHESRQTTNLPDELISEQVERITLLAAVTGDL